MWSDEPFDFTTAYFLTRIPGRLRSEIVRFFMYDHSFSYDFCDGKSFVVKYAVGISLTAKEGRHVTGMIWMCGILGIIVCPRVREIVTAVSGFVYVHGIEIA